MDVKIEAQDEKTYIATLTGILKKDDARQMTAELESLGVVGCRELTIDCANLAAIAYDSVTLLISTLDRLKRKRVKTTLTGVNPVVWKALAGGGADRVAEIKARG